MHMNITDASAQLGGHPLVFNWETKKHQQIIHLIRGCSLSSPGRHPTHTEEQERAAHWVSIKEKTHKEVGQLK